MNSDDQRESSSSSDIHSAIAQILIQVLPNLQTATELQSTSHCAMRREIAWSRQTGYEGTGFGNELYRVARLGMYDAR